jgi:hypothetical protein
MPDPSGPGLSNSDGHVLARQLRSPSLPHDLHDYVLEGLCKAVDGIHVLLVVRTGGGKTGIFYGYVLLLLALKELESPCPLLKRKFPENPVMVIVYLEEEMVSLMVHIYLCSYILIDTGRRKPSRTLEFQLWPSMKTHLQQLVLVMRTYGKWL